MTKIKYITYRVYSYIIPTIVLVVYLCYAFFADKGNCSIPLIQDSTGFLEACKSIANFSSIVLGIYGVLVPILLGKQEEKFIKRFWKLIDRKEFVRDMKKIIFSGILIILISSGLLISDIMSELVLNILICLLIWLLFFFSCSSYRLIGVFVSLIVGIDNKDDSQKKVDRLVSEEKEQEIKESFEEL